MTCSIIWKTIKESLENSEEIPNIQNEGLGKNLAFAAGIALAGIGGVNAQNNTTPSHGTEMTRQSNPYAAVVGYISNLSQSMNGEKSVEQMAALKEAGVYFENLRDGERSSNPSKAAQVVIDHVLPKMKQLSSGQLQALAMDGMNIRHK